MILLHDLILEANALGLRVNVHQDRDRNHWWRAACYNDGRKAEFVFGSGEGTTIEEAVALALASAKTPPYIAPARALSAQDLSAGLKDLGLA
jgi:hypothetical protein